SSSSTAHIVLRDGYHLHGESMDGAILKSQFPLSVNENSTTKTVSIFGKFAITIKNLTFTSNFEGVYYTDRVNNNPDRSAPGVHLYIDDSGSTPSRQVTVDSCKFEKFRAAAIRLANSSDCVIRNCDFRLATDVGGGGAGYGISLQGNGHGNDSYGLARDSRYNLIENNVFTGPQIRHGVVVQYYSHNNLIRNNVLIETTMDALDLHGEDEYNNEICHNTVTDVTMGGGVGVGNTGADHDASGYNNYIHHNTFQNCREGVKVYLGSPNTRIEYNIVENTTVSSSRGIYILNGPYTTIKNNIIRYNSSTGFIGIYLKHDSGTQGAHDGDPEYVWIDSNEVYYNGNGVWIENGQNIYYGQDNIVHSNTQTDTLFGVNVTWLDVSDVDEPIEPLERLLLSSYPNPFNEGFVLEFQLPSDGQADIQIVDIRGRKVGEIYSGILSAGQHGVHVNTPELSSGIYFIHLMQGADTQTHKIILVR
ncbi:MAG: T9SS type A sorting domain-containing protein, partial [Bacteroidetes bacterium]|nr:T9SS type A sorting domain-containing protein [Bacteroidota bacterium]